MNLYLFNKELEEDFDAEIDKPATYVIAETVEKAVETYKEGPNNNKCIWSISYLSPMLSGKGHRPILIQKELL